MILEMKQKTVADVYQDDEQSDDGYLGPALVHKAAGRKLEVALPNNLVWATLALAYPYQPVPEDIVLVISQRGVVYVIGILEGKGKTSFVAPADMEFLAPRGSIDFVSSTECRLRSRKVTIEANKLEVLADSVFERFVSATQWVKGTIHIRAGRIRTRVNASYDVKAERIVQKADRDVKIDGQKIHLG